jgi:putative tryptophan/tyrosine transport system substrate-binding protein
MDETEKSLLDYLDILRRRKLYIIIAFSKSYLKAGALAAIYSSPVDVARDTVDWFANPRASTVGGLYKPTHYSLNFNKSVAANLQIELKPDQFYRDHLNKDAR